MLQHHEHPPAYATVLNVQDQRVDERTGGAVAVAGAVAIESDIFDEIFLNMHLGVDKFANFLAYYSILFMLRNTYYSIRTAYYSVLIRQNFAVCK